jgi:hypothetical protein
MNAETKTKLDKLIDALEERISRLKAVRTALDDDVIADDIATLFGDIANSDGATRTPPHKPKGKGKLFLKVKTFFESRNNTPATLREIIAATKLNIHSLRQVLYKTAADEFERESQPGAQRQTKFWLKSPQSGELEEPKEKAQ